MSINKQKTSTIMNGMYVRLEFPEYQQLQEKEGFGENSEFCAESNAYYVSKDWYDRQERIDTCQAIADKVTATIMDYFFGDRYHDCNDISEDKEMNHAWEYFNEIIYEEINSYYGSDAFQI